MKDTSNANRRNKLTLRRETLCQLTTEELKLVVGGRQPPRTGVCTTRSPLE